MISSKNHVMEMPRKVVLGSGILNGIDTIMRELGMKYPVVLCDEITYDIAAKEVIECLGSSFILTGPASYEEVERIKKEISPEADVVVGVGGGTVIDLAKLSSRMKSIPFISVPTTASHDGISSSRASIKTKNQKTSIKALPPLAILADTKVIAGAPYRFLAAGCADLIANYTAVKDWEMASRLKGEYYSEYAAQLSLLSAKLMIKNAGIIKKGSEGSVRKVLKGLISSGIAMSIAGSSRPASGSEHLFSHALDEIAPHPAMHGEQCGVGSIMMMYLHGGKWRAIQRALRTVRAPTNAQELEIEPEYIVNALTVAHKIRDRFTILGSHGLTEDAARSLAKNTGVI
ncbi:MAG: NAD(P)-dependent glycerol-1-phosphate dehydrogenase [Candidatus Methanofastidiosia archaeon]